MALKAIIHSDVGSKIRSGGSSTFLLDLCELLIKKGISLRVISPLKIEEIEYSYDYPFIDYIPIKNYGSFGFGDPLFSLEHTWKILKKYRNEKLNPDVVQYDLAQPAMHFLKDYPSVCMFHGSNYAKLRLRNFLSPWDAWYAVGNKVYSFWEGYVLRNSDLCFFNSNYTKEMLLRDYKLRDNARFVVSYLGINTARFESLSYKREIFLHKYGVNRDEKIVTYVAGLVAHKRHSLLVNLVPDILRVFPKVKFLLVGRDIGELPSVVKLINKLGVKDKIILRGEVPREEIPEVYFFTDIYVHVSSNETFSYSIVEAMSSKKPVIAFKVGALKEIVKDGYNGFLVDDNTQFVQRLLFLLTHPRKAQEMGLNGYRRVVAEFSIDKICSKLIDGYYKAISHKGNSGNERHSDS